MNKKQTQNNSYVSITALKILEFIALDEKRIERFSNLTGVQYEQLSKLIDDPFFHAALMDYLLQDERLLLEFAESNKIDPQLLMQQRLTLPGSTRD